MTVSSPSSGPLPSALTAEACVRALAARDARFDGLFFVGITSTRIYCRPVCPARVSHTDRRRFFASAAAAERAGFRPCLRCRPELAPGRAPVDAVSRLGEAAARRIEAGALNGHTVTELATDLGVSARHLRRALEREYGVAPSELAQTYRLLLAKRLLADTTLSVTRIAFASGFQSLRRFNAAFREQYRMSPSAVRRTPGRNGSRVARTGAASLDDGLRLTLSYRAPFDWLGLLASLARGALPGVERIEPVRYCRTVRLDGQAGLISVANADRHLIVEIASSLVPALMPLLPRLRRLFDLDAEPLMIDDHLARTGLADLVRDRPGVRLPGVLDPFDAVLGVLGRAGGPPHVTRAIIEALGTPIASGDPDLAWLAPDAERVAAAGLNPLVEAGMDVTVARALLHVANAMRTGDLGLDAGADMDAACAALKAAGVTDAAATEIAIRTLCWPDAFRGNAGPSLESAEAWRPWRAYAAMHLELARDERQRGKAMALPTRHSPGSRRQSERHAV